MHLIDRISTSTANIKAGPDPRIWWPKKMIHETVVKNQSLLIVLFS